MEHILFEGFIWKHLNHHLSYPIRDFHRELILLTTYPKVAVAAPTGFAKSTYFSFFYPLFKLLEKPGIQILLISATGSLAEHWALKIRQELEFNPGILAYYGPQNSKGKWAVDELHMDNGSVLMAKGAEKQIRGFRPDLIICDDIETDEMVLSTERRKKFDAWFWTALSSRLKPDGRLLVIGTFLHPESFMAELVNKGREGWTTRFYAAIKQDDESLWPDMWPLTALESKRKEMGEYAFQQEYMNNPLPDDLRIFQKEWIKYYDRLPEAMAVFTTIDPAISVKDSADKTAIITCGVDADRNIYVLDVVNSRLLPSEVVDAVFSVYERFKPAVIGIETEGFQRLYKRDLEQERIKRGLYPVIRELKSGGRRKELRIEGLQPFFESGKIMLKANDKNQEELVTQLLRFPSRRCKDDAIDALAYQLDIIKPANEQAEQINPDSVYASILARKRGRLNSSDKYYGN